MRFKTVCIIIGVINMFNIFGCSTSPNLKYERYSSVDPEINISMDYISDWLYSEHRGSHSSYSQVLFYEKAAGDKPFKAGISVTVKNLSNLGVSPASIEAVAEDIYSKRMKFKDGKSLAKSSVKLTGEKAINLEFSYKTLDKLYDVNAKLLPIKERVIIFQKGSKFYIIRYENTAEDFSKFTKAFNHILKSIKFK
jgi:hypothetical protein